MISILQVNKGPASSLLYVWQFHWYARANYTYRISNSYAEGVSGDHLVSWIKKGYYSIFKNKIQDFPFPNAWVCVLHHHTLTKRHSSFHFASQKRRPYNFSRVSFMRLTLYFYVLPGHFIAAHKHTLLSVRTGLYGFPSTSVEPTKVRYRRTFLPRIKIMIFLPTGNQEPAHRPYLYL